MAWQDGKVANHAIAIPLIDGVLIRPGETFSFWRLVGRPTAARGFVEGMELSGGRARGGVGGGLCQIGNLLHWIALHSPLQVTQRAPHSFDPFPDQGRVIPYGTGAALFYNYIDLWLFNPTEQVLQMRLWMDDRLIHGELRGEQPEPNRYHVFERNAGFEQRGGDWLRHNEIWREIREKGQAGRLLARERLYGNRVRVMYDPTAEAS
ncbi:VanW family protein [Oceanicola sp. D3]|uniref:VanW family protein n=1 Tax=Oceanicola sp. D3 TaxID=2587163 RepID=UPI001AEF4F8E|nr:VanW family protein [Oceanicola sp. D3]